MPRITSFAALRYGPAAGDPALLLAPPYDVIDPALAVELRDRGPHNAIRLVLPEGDGDTRYAAAAARLDAWRDAGVLRQDDVPSVYVYRQRYTVDGDRVERFALFGALELEERGTGVLPHERTHAGPKADRLALTLATRTQLSPIFLLARDDEASLLEALRGFSRTPAAFEATTPDGIEHSLWVIDEAGAAAVLCALVGRHPLLIADGHHRYETALEVARLSAGEGRVDGSDRVLACVVSDEDPGLVIRPTHRTLTADALAAVDLPVLLREHFEIDELPGLDPAAAEVEAAGDPARLIVMPGGGGVPMRLARRPARDGGGDDGHGDGHDGGGDDGHDGRADQAATRAAAGIAAVLFERHVMGDILGTDADSAAHDGLLEYHRGAAEAVRRAGAGGAAFILPPVSLDAVWQVTTGGVRLPPKSTYFEPKVPSGLLFRPLDERGSPES